MNRKRVHVSRVAEEDLELLEDHLDFGPPSKHRTRFAKQMEGRAVYLIAWYGDVPVGHLFLKWDGSKYEPMASALHAVPEIEDFFVLPEHRSRSIGSMLMNAAEQLAREYGYSRIGLGCAVDNRRARVLYQRRGYRNAGLGKYRDRGIYIDRDGNQESWEDVCIYLIKEL